MNEKQNPLIRCELLAAVIASGAQPEIWADRLAQSIKLFEGETGSANIEGEEVPRSKPVSLPFHKPVILKAKKRFDDENGRPQRKLFAVIECAGEEVKGNAWDEHGDKLEQFNKGDRLELIIKRGTYINFEDPRSMVAIHEG